MFGYTQIQFVQRYETPPRTVDRVDAVPRHAGVDGLSADGDINVYTTFIAGGNFSIRSDTDNRIIWRTGERAKNACDGIVTPGLARTHGSEYQAPAEIGMRACAIAATAAVIAVFCSATPSPDGCSSRRISSVLPRRGRASLTPGGSLRRS